MNKPHVHATLIKAKADGHIIQERKDESEFWRTMNEGDFTFYPSYQYQIKPEREWPVTSLSEDQLEDIYNNAPGVEFSHIANAAIKQYLIDSEK